MACSIEAALRLLREMYATRIEMVRRTLSTTDRLAAVRALKEELRAALRGVVERNRLVKAHKPEAYTAFSRNLRERQELKRGKYFQTMV